MALGQFTKPTAGVVARGRFQIPVPSSISAISVSVVVTCVGFGVGF